MEIILTEQFIANVKDILDFYASNSPQTARNFFDALYEKIESIPFMAYRFRKNKDFHQDNVRDLIFKGYVIPFKIDDDSIKIIAIYKHNIPKLKI